MRKIAFLTAAIAIAALSAGCKSKVEKAYAGCIEKQTASIMKRAEQGPPQLRETVEKSAPALIEAACGPIKTVCGENWDSAACQSFVKAGAGAEFANPPE